jgi:hypothetical protein
LGEATATTINGLSITGNAEGFVLLQYNTN